MLENRGKEIQLLDGTLSVANFGDEFLILKATEASRADLPQLGRAIFGQKPGFIDEVIATETEICFKLNERFDSQSLLTLQTVVAQAEESTKRQTRRWKLPIKFTSETSDWDGVEAATGLEREKYIDQLMKCSLNAAMFGFLPGFVYIRGLREYLQVARKANPDRQCSARSLAVGGPYVGVYSLPSPAGWHVIGSVAVELLNRKSLPPVDVQPGDVIELEELTAERFEAVVSQGVSLREYNG